MSVPNEWSVDKPKHDQTLPETNSKKALNIGLVATKKQIN